jgi:hypothetical protein
MTSTAGPDALRLFDQVPALPEDSVLLHVGVHKTGTTAIQAALANARPELVKSGVLYPGKRQAQHRSAMAATGRQWGGKDKGGGTYDRSVYEWLVRKTTEHSRRAGSCGSASAGRADPCS